MSVYQQVQKQLFELAEPEYAKFSSGLLPGTERMIGVRLPLLRKEAKRLVKEECWREYVEEFNRQYDISKDAVLFEEIMLTGMIIGLLKTSKISLQEVLDFISDFIPKIDNWSVCDSFCAGLKIAKDQPDEIWDFIIPYLKSNREYELRFVIVMMLDYYIEEIHVDEIINGIDHLQHEAYYVKMAAAWCLSMCYVKFPEKTLEYLKSEQNHLDDFTYNKTIQKIIESLKVSKEEKKVLRTIKHFANS